MPRIFNRSLTVAGLVAGLFISIAVSGCGKKEEPAPSSMSGGAVAPNLSMTEQRFNDLLKTDPANLNALVGLGNLYYDTGRFAEAAEQYEKALKIDPGNIDVIVDQGTCFRNIKQPAKAIDNFKKALEINPAHENARFNLGIVLAFDMTDKQGAINVWEELLKRYPNTAKASDIREYITKFKAELAASSPGNRTK